MRLGYDLEWEVKDREAHHTGGLVAYEYSIHHEVNPYNFPYSCNTYREIAYSEGINNLIVKFAIDDDFDFEQKYLITANPKELKME